MRVWNETMLRTYECEYWNIWGYEETCKKKHKWLIQTNKQAENCFINQISSILFCCTDSLLMTHRGGLSLSIIIWGIGGGGGGKFPFALGPKNSLGGPADHQMLIMKA